MRIISDCDCDLFLLILGWIGVGDVVAIALCKHFHWILYNPRIAVAIRKIVQRGGALRSSFFLFKITNLRFFAKECFCMKTWNASFSIYFKGNTQQGKSCSNLVWLGYFVRCNWGKFQKSYESPQACHRWIKLAIFSN